MKRKIETPKAKQPKRPDGPASRGGGGRTSPGRPAADLPEPEIIIDPEAEARREKARERARRWRVEQKAKVDPEAAARLAQEQAEREAAEREAAERAARLAELDALVVGGLTGLIDAGTTAIQHLWMDPSKPQFGAARARIVAQAWAPIVRPHLETYLGDNPEIMLATLLTAGVVGTWIAEYQGAPAGETQH